MKKALRRPLLAVTTAVAATAATALIAPATPAGAAPQGEVADTAAFRDAVSVQRIVKHLSELQKAADKNGDNRVAGAPGHEASVDYVSQRLHAAGYEVTLDEFTFVYDEDRSAPTLSSDGTAFTTPTDFRAMAYSPSGTVTAAPYTPTGTGRGCTADEFGAATAGKVAVIERGVCSFAIKATHAAAAGAVAVVVFNNTTGVVNGTLGGPTTLTIPVLGATTAVGTALRAANRVSVSVDRLTEERTTRNVLAELPRSKRASEGSGDVVLVGAHLDSVAAGPGINDNGTGSAGILAIAEQLARLDKDEQPRNTVRFAWWSAEEFGLLGSKSYVERLSQEQKDEIALNLNFDMIGSPNYVRFVYDGDNSAFPAPAQSAKGPQGSGEIERVFTDYFTGVGLTSGETPFSGRSDYGPFIDKGIPAGGLFTGAEGVKTEGQAGVYGGEAGQAYDACYHQACDDLDNVNVQGLDEMSDAAAHATLLFARRDLTQAPLVDPAQKVRGTDGVTPSGGGLHEDHDHDHGDVS